MNEQELPTQEEVYIAAKEAGAAISQIITAFAAKYHVRVSGVELMVMQATGDRPSTTYGAFPVIEYRDGTIVRVEYRVRPYKFSDEEMEQAAAMLENPGLMLSKEERDDLMHKLVLGILERDGRPVGPRPTTLAGSEDGD